MAYTPTWITPKHFPIQRQYYNCLAVGWWQHSVISLDNPIVLKEIPYGGYTLHIEFEPDFWEWSSSGWYHDKIVKDLWAQPPNSSTRVNAGAIHREAKYVPECRINILNFTNYPSNGHYSFIRLPIAPTDFWHQNFPLPTWNYQYRPPALSSTPCPSDTALPLA